MLRPSLLFALVVGCSSAEPPSDPFRPVVATESLSEVPWPPRDEDGPPTAIDSDPLPPYAFPFFPDEAAHSVSIGDTTHGRLAHGRALVESEALKILPKQRERDLKYGTDELVTLLTETAALVKERKGGTLWVGNLGKLQGGDIVWSVSHNAGRDADVAFAYKNPADGAPVDPPDLIPLGARGLSKDGKYAFDAARTWILIQAMVELGGPNIQYLFVSDGLKKKVLVEARKSGAPPAIIERASELLRQPAGAAPHDDHLHVRLYCGQFDVRGGCLDFGTVNSFSKLYRQERGIAQKKARRELSAEGADRREVALLRLGLIGDESDPASFVPQLRDASEAVRYAAIVGLFALGSEAHVPELVKAYRVETSPKNVAAIIQTVGHLGGEAAGVFLRDELSLLNGELVPKEGPPSSEARPSTPTLTPFDFQGDRSPISAILFARSEAPPGALEPPQRRSLLVRAAATADRLEPVAPLIEMIRPDDEPGALMALSALEFITNHRVHFKSDERPPKTRFEEAKARLTQLIQTMGKRTRDGWLIAGFSARGYGIRSLDNRALWELLRAQADEPFLAENGRRAMDKILSPPTDVRFFGPGDACRTFRAILYEKRKELRIGRPGEAQKLACSQAREKEKNLAD